MPKLKVEVVTAERIVYSAEADIVIAPGIEGQLGILPHHAPLMTMLRPGELIIRRGQEEDIMAVSGGFLEVRPDRVVILADAAERAEEIDVARAEAARKRAEEKLKARRAAGIDEAQAEAALRRAIARLTVVEKAKQRRKR